MATQCTNKNHSAAFPDALPEWFIKLFTDPGDSVLDPFMGSGTTVLVARRMGRKGIGIEIKEEYYRMVENALNLKQPTLFENKELYGTNNY